jgi:hypothetical protein
MTRGGLIYGFATTVLLIALAGQSSGQEVAPASRYLESTPEKFFAKFATVDFDAAPPSDPDELEQRRIKNQRYDNQGWVKTEPPAETDWVKRALNTQSPPVFPIAESDVIVTGIATVSSAHLSNDKTGIYSEYSVRVEQVLKNNTSREMIRGSVITVDRAGGAVRYPNGRKIAYMIAESRLPDSGRTYTLFLRDGKRNTNFEIVSLYELNVNSVIPLDARPSIDEIKGIGKADFVKTIQEKLVKP